jgi:hypothetical protein
MCPGSSLVAAAGGTLSSVLNPGRTVPTLGIKLAAYVPD